MKYKKKGFWTEENCAIEASKYKTKIDFRKKCSSAYSISLRNGWIKKICSHMSNYREDKGFWNKDNCTIEALKYNNRTDLQNNASGCYSAALKNGWLDEICAHMIFIHHKNNYWTKDKCGEEASKYTHRIDFVKNSNKAYRAASKKGWLDDICKHMIKIGDTHSRCIYAIEFSDNSVYIGLTYNIEKRFKDHIADVEYNSSSVLKHIKKTGLTPLLKQLTDYLDVLEASKLEGIKKSEYEKYGWNILNKVKCGGVGGNKIKWTKEKCEQTALKFNTKKDFRMNYGSAYTISLKNKWLDEICGHMELRYVNNSDQSSSGSNPNLSSNPKLK